MYEELCSPHSVVQMLFAAGIHLRKGKKLRGIFKDENQPLFAAKDIQSNCWETFNFVDNLGMTQRVSGDDTVKSRSSCYLRHYDAMRTETDM